MAAERADAARDEDDEDERRDGADNGLYSSGDGVDKPGIEQAGAGVGAGADTLPAPGKAAEAGIESKKRLERVPEAENGRPGSVLP